MDYKDFHDIKGHFNRNVVKMADRQVIAEQVGGVDEQYLAESKMVTLYTDYKKALAELDRKVKAFVASQKDRANPTEELADTTRDLKNAAARFGGK